MYKTDPKIHTLATASAREVLLQADINGDTLTSEHILGIDITEAVNTSNGINMGSTIASKLEFRFKMPSRTLLLGNGEIIPRAGFEGCEDMVPLGKFYISDSESSDDFTTVVVTAFDGFCKTEVLYTPEIDMPNTASAILVDIAFQCGFELSEDIPKIYEDSSETESSSSSTEEVLFDLYNWTCRQYIGYFASLCGKNARFNREGKLSFVWYTSEGFKISRKLQYLGGFKRLTENDVEITSITSGTEDEQISSGSGFGFSFENPLMTQERLDSIYSNLGEIRFAPSTVKWRGDPALEAGDIVSVEDKHGNWHTVFVMEQRLSISGGMYSEIKCYGQSEQSASFSVSPTEKKLRQAYKKLQEAIAAATKLLNGANGGVFEILDEDGNGINDGWIIHSADGQQFIKANLNGIGITRDGGRTYQEAMTTAGINASSITVGSMNADRISVGGASLGDVFSVELDDNGHPIVTIGASDSDIKQQQTNDAVSFVNGAGDVVAEFSPTGAKWENMQSIRYCGYQWIKSPSSGNVRFTAIKEEK